MIILHQFKEVGILRIWTEQDENGKDVEMVNIITKKKNYTIRTQKRNKENINLTKI
jgi:hypothetical protein